MLEEEEAGCSSSDWAGLGGRDARMISSSFSITVSTLAVSDIVIFCRAEMTLSRGLSESDLTSGEEWQEEEEEGEGVSLRMGTREDSMVGLSVVRILDTAMRLGG